MMIHGYNGSTGYAGSFLATVSIALLKSFKIFFIIFMSSPLEPLVVQVLCEILKIIVFKVLIAFKEVDNEIEV